MILLNFTSSVSGRHRWCDLEYSDKLRYVWKVCGDTAHLSISLANHDILLFNTVFNRDDHCNLLEECRTLVSKGLNTEAAYKMASLIPNTRLCTNRQMRRKVVKLETGTLHTGLSRTSVTLDVVAL